PEADHVLRVQSPQPAAEAGGSQFLGGQLRLQHRRNDPQRLARRGAGFDRGSRSIRGENSMKRILITGITGFVGSHLAELCLEKNIRPFGFKRYHLSNMKNVQHIEDDVEWVDCDMMDAKA